MAAQNPPGPPQAEHEFTCTRCGQWAGAIRLVGSESRADVVRDSFTSRLTCRVPSAAFDRVRSAIERGDVAELYRLNFEYTPFYCPDCQACFCEGHWRTRDVFDGDWHDSIRGTCPEGHERMLED